MVRKEDGECMWLMEVTLSGQFNMNGLFRWGLVCWVSFVRV